MPGIVVLLIIIGIYYLIKPKEKNSVIKVNNPSNKKNDVLKIHLHVAKKLEHEIDTHFSNLGVKQPPHLNFVRDTFALSSTIIFMGNRYPNIVDEQMIKIFICRIHNNNIDFLKSIKFDNAYFSRYYDRANKVIMSIYPMIVYDMVELSNHQNSFIDYLHILLFDFITWQEDLQRYYLSYNANDNSVLPSNVYITLLAHPVNLINDVKLKHTLEGSLLMKIIEFRYPKLLTDLKICFENTMKEIAISPNLYI